MAVSWNLFLKARTRAEAQFDALLRIAPPFMVADFGGEAWDSWSASANRVDGEEEKDLFAEWTGAPSRAGAAGMVVDERLWRSIREPSSAKLIAPGRYAWPRLTEAELEAPRANLRDQHE